MKLCSQCREDIVCCDFCRMFNYNGNKEGTYLGNGYCVYHETSCEPLDVCNDFVCMFYKMEGYIKKEFRSDEGSKS
jgi:hypothetical protein